MAGRPRALDEMKMREICALLSVGCSRNEAAEYVGCSISTIENTIKRDKDFGQRVRRTEMAAEVGMLKQIRDASSRSWRAAAWALEHLNPQRYARRRADYLTFEEVDEFITQMTSALAPAVAASPVGELALERLDKIVAEFETISQFETTSERRRRISKVIDKRRREIAQEERDRRNQEDEQRRAQWEEAYEKGQPGNTSEQKGLEVRGSDLGDEEE